LPERITDRIPALTPMPLSCGGTVAGINHCRKQPSETFLYLGFDAQVSGKMDYPVDNIKRLLESIRSAGFFSRVFGWRKIKDQLPGAATDLQKLVSDLSFHKEKIALLESGNQEFRRELQQGVKTLETLHYRKTELELELSAFKRDFQHLLAQSGDLKKENIELRKEEEFRTKEHSNAIASLSKIQEKIQGDRDRELEDRNALTIENLRKLKDTWKNHQENARNSIKLICSRHTIHYEEKAPFRGDPDNVLKICDEYVVFDAKSPAGNELGNFPHYLKDQAEKAKKYTQQENVRSDVFFVVPSNTLDYLPDFVFRHGDHNTYIISQDALEPVILALKKIEEYEFAEQLSPEDRENICRVLGRFAHLSKRRIQVDSFFAKQFIELSYKCETDLPPEMLETIAGFERSEKLNPPQEKRAKSIPVSELENDAKKIRQEADSRGILMEQANISDHLNGLPLYKKTDD
jgi:hypothetical protein